MLKNDSTWLARLFPFLGWWPMTRETLRADLIAGVTVALVLVPQSMAYAQLAGLPVVYGLYAAFLPVMVASLWGSLRQLHTGPTAMLSLLSAAALLPFASVGSEQFIELSVMLALMVGVLRLLLGLFRLGLVVNLLSHPVVVGFTNAAALIIGLSQLNKLINVPMPRSDSFLSDLWAVVTQLEQTHWPTVGFAFAAFLIIYGLQRFFPRAPAILVAIMVTTVASAWFGFERTASVSLASIEDASFRARLGDYTRLNEAVRNQERRLAQLQAERSRATQAARVARADLDAELDKQKVRLTALREQAFEARRHLHAVRLSRVETPTGPVFRSAGTVVEGEPAGAAYWRFAAIKGDTVSLSSGGEVVGTIPKGLPSFTLPHIAWQILLPLLPAALIMALLGFMEATSISKAISARTGQRVDTNQELIGQGLANIVGSFFQSYVVSGSFSRSALAARAGAQTGLFAIISALCVMLVILFLTPLLYHLPQAVLAVIIMFAVFGLVRIEPLLQAWRVNRVDAVIGLVTFVATLALAPALAQGILLGVGLTVAAYVVRNMRPRAEILGRRADGTLAGMDSHHLPPVSDQYVALRFDGSLDFVNVAYFEEAVLEALRRFPQAKAVLVVGSGINDMDASGEAQLRAVARQLKARGVDLYFSSLKKQVRAAFERGGLDEVIPKEHLFANKEAALAALAARYGHLASVTPPATIPSSPRPAGSS
ncbi:SulP family inorganic anion transporter [Thiobacter aerophilum]|uniref:SulP family inorganic anion transporter n=1 Tax=Thiobacter aerophilum TaxID=3121275 RepID=A0ABV0EGH6_9BURK